MSPGVTQTSSGSSESGDAPGTSANTTVAFDSTTGEAPTTGAASAEAASSGSTGTGAGEPGEVVVPAVIATCALLDLGLEPYLGPQECEPRSIAAGGLGRFGVMALDAAFLEEGGKGRPARVFLRFDVPADLAGRDLKAATVAVRAAGGPTAGGPHAGELWATEPFDLATLAFFAPTSLEALTGNPGVVLPSAWIAWDLPVERLEPGEPLHLGLVAVDDDGVLYRSGLAAPGFTPVLTIAYE